MVSTVGSCSCYALSQLVGRRLVHALWPRKIEQYAAEVQRRRADLLNYVIFLRVTPVLPNTFVNVASPIVGVPLAPFMLGTLLGCLPNNVSGGRVAMRREGATVGAGHLCTAGQPCLLGQPTRPHSHPPCTPPAPHPAQMVAVSAGSRLSELQSLSDLYDPRVLLVGEGGPSLRAPPCALCRRSRALATAASCRLSEAQHVPLAPHPPARRWHGGPG